MEPQSEIRAPLSPQERRWALIFAAVVVFVTCIPYLYAAAIKPAGTTFGGFMYNPDDQCVYLSWVRQAAEGRFFIENKFTSEEQRPLLFNLFSLPIGWFARVAHVSLPFVLHIARVGASFGLLVLVYRFLALFLWHVQTRRIAFVLIATSSGLGWTMWQTHGHTGPIDVWQPEAITFLSMYTNALFVVSLVLMVGTFYLAILAWRARSLRLAAWAGIVAFVLTNVHSYDIVTVWATLGLALILDCAKVSPEETQQATSVGDLWGRAKDGLRGFPKAFAATWRYPAMVIAVSAPMAAYQYWVARADPVFSSRSAQFTESGEFTMTVMGFGIPLFLALFSVMLALLGTRKNNLFLVAWMAAGIVLAHLANPFAAQSEPLIPFQRKLLMGVHIPICMLAAYTLIQFKFFQNKRAFLGIAFGLIAVTAPSNVAFMVRDGSFAASGIASTGAHLVYVPADELTVMSWLEKHTDHRERVLCHPWTLGCRIPYESGNSVYVGHWSETIDFAEKFRLARQFFTGPASEPWRNQFLADAGCHYVVMYTDPERASGIWGGREDTASLTEYLGRFERVYENSELAVYRISGGGG